MTPEDRLRQALRAAAGSSAPDSTGSDRVLAVAARRRRRRTTALSSLALTAVLAIAGATLLRDDARVETVPAIGRASSTTTSTTTVPAPPPTVVTLTDKGALVVVDTATGRTVRTLAQQAGPGLSRTPDGQSVYFGLDTKGCDNGDLFVVPVDGSAPPRRVTAGVLPVVSPDGTRLAAMTWKSTPDACLTELVVRTLATGAEQRWTAQSNGFFELGFVDRIDWSADGRRLVFGFNYEGSGSHILDTGRSGSLNDARSLEGPAGARPAWRPDDGRIAVLLECCAELGGPEVPPRTVLIDPATGQEETLLEADVQPQWMDFDATGRFLAYVDKAGVLHVKEDGRPPRRLASGFTAVSW